MEHFCPLLLGHFYLMLLRHVIPFYWDIFTPFYFDIFTHLYRDIFTPFKSLKLRLFLVSSTLLRFSALKWIKLTEARRKVCGKSCFFGLLWIYWRKAERKVESISLRFFFLTPFWNLLFNLGASTHCIKESNFGPKNWILQNLIYIQKSVIVSPP